jgi:dephospho-CoA kinase
VITDCRRKSEFNAFKDFLSIYIDAPLSIRKQRIIDRDGHWDDEWPNHPAEKEIRELKWLCDFYITNDGTIEELKVKLDDLLNYVERTKLK